MNDWPRWTAGAVTFLVCMFLFVPILLSALDGVTANVFVGMTGGWTFRWIEEVWTGYQATLWRSLGVAFATVALCILLAVPLAYALAVNNGRISRIIEELFVLPVAVPGLATGLALILAYGAMRDFRSSSAFIVVGHVLFTLPFMLRSVSAVLLSIDLAMLEESAATLGASRLQRFWTIVVPNAAGGILTGALMVFTLSIGEFNITWMLHTPTTQTLPVGLSDAYSSLRLEVGSAYTIIFFLVIVPVLIGMQYASSRLEAGKPAI